MSAVWWATSSLTGYLGESSTDGLQWERHTPMCKPGKWAVCVTGWSLGYAAAVVDDFGNLVQVPA